MEERRKFPRRTCTLNVRYRLDEEGSDFVDTVGLNISDRGMYLRPSGGLKEGQRIRLRYTLPDLAEVRNARAAVVRQELQDCVAVVFLSVYPNVQELFA